MTDWSTLFNSLPDDIRLIGCAMEEKTRIQHLEMEKDRIRKNFDRTMREINEHVESCEKRLVELESKIIIPEP